MMTNTTAVAFAAVLADPAAPYHLDQSAHLALLFVVALIAV